MWFLTKTVQHYGQKWLVRFHKYGMDILKITWVFLEDVVLHLKSSTAHIYRDETISAFAFESHSLSLSTSVVLIPRAKDRWLRFFFNHAHGHWILKLTTQQSLLVFSTVLASCPRKYLTSVKLIWRNNTKPNAFNQMTKPFENCLCLSDVAACLRSMPSLISRGFAVCEKYIR